MARLRRKKARPVKRVRRKAAPSKKKIFSVRKKPAAEAEVLGIRETVVEKAKYFTPPETKPLARPSQEELPDSYGKDVAILQVRDPWWLHAYWEVTPQTWEGLKRQLGSGFSGARTVLRVYDVTNIIFDGSNANHFFDLQVHEDSRSWYIDTQGPGRSWCVDLGLLLSDGRFITILRSNVVATPLDRPSWVTDEEWAIPDDMFARLYGMGFGFGKSSPVGKSWQERMKAVSSPGMASMASPVKVKQKKGFWLAVDTELILYGATEPDALVTVQGSSVRLRSDGTFSLRFALPDGKQVIPVKAVSSDRQHCHVVTVEVNRQKH